MKNWSSFALLLACSGSLISTSRAQNSDYLATVRGYAEAMIERGRDDYGAQKSPLFASTLSLPEMRVPLASPPAATGIRAHDRTVSGGNPMHDQNFYQSLYALSQITGDPKYAREADAALSWFWKNCQSPQTGLMAWGEHLGWDFHREARITQPKNDDTHEFYRPWVLGAKSYELAPREVLKFAQGLWRHQIYDAKTGAFSRHAKWSAHGPEKDYEFPRHAGFYIEVWALEYRRSQRAEIQEAVETMLAYYERARNEKTGAIPGESKTPELVWPSSNLSLAISLENAAPAMPTPITARMRALAKSADEVFLKIPHELGEGGRGFVKSALASTLEPGDPTARGASKNGFFSRTWASGYGDQTDANFALQCLLRFEQTRDERFKNLALEAARRYLNSAPDPSQELFPEVFADAISLLTRAHKLTGEAAFLTRADELASQSVALFWRDSPLPRASSRLEHYETITRADSLGLALLELWTLQNKPALKLETVWCDR